MAVNTSSVTAQAGRNLLLKISDGTSPTTYVTVAGLRATDITMNGATVDITNKSSNAWRELLPNAGVRSVDITASGVWDSSAQNNNLRTLMLTVLAGGTFFEGEIVSGSGDKFTGTWSAMSFKRGGNHNAEETFDLTLQSHGPVVYSNP